MRACGRAAARTAPTRIRHARAGAAREPALLCASWDRWRGRGPAPRWTLRAVLLLAAAPSASGCFRHTPSPWQPRAQGTLVAANGVPHIEPHSAQGTLVAAGTRPATTCSRACLRASALNPPGIQPVAAVATPSGLIPRRCVILTTSRPGPVLSSRSPTPTCRGTPADRGPCHGMRACHVLNLLADASKRGVA